MERVPSTDWLRDGRDESLLQSGSCCSFRRCWIRRSIRWRRHSLHPGCRPGSSILLHCLTFADELEKEELRTLWPFNLDCSATWHVASQHVPSSTTTSTRINTLFPPMQRALRRDVQKILPHLAAKTLWWWAQKRKKVGVSSKTKQELTSIDRVTWAGQHSIPTDYTIGISPDAGWPIHISLNHSIMNIFLLLFI